MYNYIYIYIYIYNLMAILAQAKMAHGKIVLRGSSIVILFFGVGGVGGTEAFLGGLAGLAGGEV